MVTCAGNQVFLMANTRETREALNIIHQGARPEGMQRAAQDFPNAFRQTTCDALGYFRFDNLAAGSWIVGTDVYWMVGYSRQGGSLADTIYVEEGQQLEVVLADGHRIAEVAPTIAALGAIPGVGAVAGAARVE